MNALTLMVFILHRLKEDHANNGCPQKTRKSVFISLSLSSIYLGSILCGLAFEIQFAGEKLRFT